MFEITEFRPEEIDEAIEGLDGLRCIIAPFLRSVNKDGMGEQDVQQFVRHLTLAKHALIAMGDFLEGKMGKKEPPNDPLPLEELREMEGDKIYVHYINGFYTDEDGAYFGKFEQLVRECNGRLTACELPLEYYGKTWIAYRRKPEEGTA